MKYHHSYFLILPLFCFLTAVPAQPARERGKSESRNTYVVFELNMPNFRKDSMQMYFRILDKESIGGQYQVISSPVVQGRAVFKIQSVKPVGIYSGGLFKFSNNWLVEPGDSIVVRDAGSGLSFGGKGSVKCRLSYELDSLRAAYKITNTAPNFKTEAIDDFLQTNRLLNEVQVAMLARIDDHKSQLSAYAYLAMRVGKIKRLHENRMDKFSGLITLANEGKINKDSLCAVFDTCFYTPEWKWAMSLGDLSPAWYAFVRAVVAREYKFDYGQEVLQDAGERRKMYYDKGKQLYTGRARELFLVDLITNETIDELGFTAVTEELLERYYAEPGFPAFKEYVRRYEEKRRVLRTNSPAPPFSLINTSGGQLNKVDLSGKLVLADFWFTGCTGCVQMTPALRAIEHRFKNDSNLVFLSVSTDKDRAKWLNSLRQKKYTTGEATNLYTGGLGTDHPMIKEYSITAYPQLFLIDENGLIVQNPLPDPRDDNGVMLCQLIENQLILMKDGPYVFGDSANRVSVNINGKTISRKSIVEPNLTVEVYFDGKNPSTIPLKRKMLAEPSVYPGAEKLLAISDIEGNLEAFRRLLQANNVIDENFRWIFGSGRLVLVGDMFDRGKQVTECLWLIYSLEEQAKRAGGYVHFILGNHEIMNLSGDYRYVHPKYVNNAQKIGEEFRNIYGSGSELGRWLRTKNIVEKIGNLLFVHGGISPEVNNLPLDLEKINAFVRVNYDQAEQLKGSKDSVLQVLFNPKTSPFWYRLYYLETERKEYGGGAVEFRATQEQVENTLKKFGVEKIITGHTIVKDTVNVHFQRKVYNIDTKHADQKSEALFVENNVYYRSDALGRRSRIQ